MKSWKGQVISRGGAAGFALRYVTNQDEGELDSTKIVIVHSVSFDIADRLIKNQVAGVLLEVGGFATHACILLRTASIPCIIINHALDIISNGQRVVLNGNTGEVMVWE